MLASTLLHARGLCQHRFARSRGSGAEQKAIIILDDGGHCEKQNRLQHFSLL